MGRPKPFAKEGGSARPARPKRVISAVPIRIARHSAGGGRLAKRLRVVDDIVDGCLWWCCRLVLVMGMRFEVRLRSMVSQEVYSDFLCVYLSDSSRRQELL